MTTSVTVKACCAPTVEVVVSVTDHPDLILQNGESVTIYVYDARSVSVKETPRLPA